MRTVPGTELRASDHARFRRTSASLFLLTAVLQFRGLFRQARYGVQLLVLPSLMVSIFLAAYFATRTLSKDTRGLFYPFLLFLVSSLSLGIPMQSGTTLLRGVSNAHLLVTPRGLRGFALYVWATQAAYLATAALSIVIALVLTPPRVDLPGAVLGLALIPPWCSVMVMFGIGFAARFQFSFYLSQMIFLSFYAFLLLDPLVGDPLSAAAFPPIGMLSMMESRGPLAANLAATLAGLLLSGVVAFMFLRWAYREYRFGRGVNRL